MDKQKIAEQAVEQHYPYIGVDEEILEPMVKAALAALDIAVPEGYVVVPVEPMQAMLDAGFDELVIGYKLPDTMIEDCYKAMIKAAGEGE